LKFRGVGECVCVHDEDNLPNRLGYARKIFNYFYGLKTGSFSPLNAIAVAPPTQDSNEETK
jgi:hypothetical protein